VAAALEELAGGALVGIRHQVHDEPDPAWLLRPDVQRGIAAVGEAGLVYDLLVRTAELPAAIETARRNPGVQFVVDHVAKPPVRAGDTAEWASGLERLAGLPNVSCKLSGLVTEADWTAWRAEELVPYYLRVLDWFGPSRCLFGSDWPVCLLAADYGVVFELVCTALHGLDDAERAAVLGGNAMRLYRL
jgi:L-fuconolactonase